jgi:hypothetical protein
MRRRLVVRDFGVEFFVGILLIQPVSKDSHRRCAAVNLGARAIRPRLVMQGREGRTQALKDELHRQGAQDQAREPGEQA